MSLPRVRIHKITWNGNNGEVLYTDAGGAVDHLRALLGSFGFHFGTPVVRRGGVGALQALPVVKRGCSLTELRTSVETTLALRSPRVMSRWSVGNKPLFVGSLH